MYKSLSENLDFGRAIINPSTPFKASSESFKVTSLIA